MTPALFEIAKILDKLQYLENFSNETFDPGIIVFVKD